MPKPPKIPTLAGIRQEAERNDGPTPFVMHIGSPSFFGRSRLGSRVIGVFEQWKSIPRVPLGHRENLYEKIKVSIIPGNVTFFAPEYKSMAPIPGMMIYGLTHWGETTTVLEMQNFSALLLKRFGPHFNELHVGGVVYIKKGRC